MYLSHLAETDIGGKKDKLLVETDIAHYLVTSNINYKTKNYRM